VYLIMEKSELLRSRILQMVEEYHEAAFPTVDFVPGKTQVPVSGKVFDAADVQSLVDSSLDFWLTTGRFAAVLNVISPISSAPNMPAWLIPVLRPIFWPSRA